MARAKVFQASLTSALAEEPAAQVAQAALVAAYTAKELAQARVSQGAMMAAYQSEPAANVSQTAVLTAYQTGVPGLVRSRAWTFDFDGHVFYALNLGEQGTFCYDTTTGAWSKFETGGYGIWNMLRGLTWGMTVIGADVLEPQVWKLDPDSPIDEEWRPIQHKVSGALPSRTSKVVNNDALRVTASAGTIGVEGAVLTLRLSDDNGRTWSAEYSRELVEGAYNQVLEFTSLGSFAAPGRVYEISDVGGNIRIDDATADINGIDTDDGG